MKKIEAIFKPFKLDELKEALANESSAFLFSKSKAPAANKLLSNNTAVSCAPKIPAKLASQFSLKTRRPIASLRYL